MLQDTNNGNVWTHRNRRHLGMICSSWLKLPFWKDIQNDQQHIQRNQIHHGIGRKWAAGISERIGWRDRLCFTGDRSVPQTNARKSNTKLPQQPLEQPQMVIHPKCIQECSTRGRRRQEGTYLFNMFDRNEQTMNFVTANVGQFYGSVYSITQYSHMRNSNSGA